MQREMIERARERLEGLLELINDWLDMSRIRAGEIVDRLRAVALRTCVDAALAGLELSARKRGVSVSTAIPPELPEVMVDPESFREALSNVISNALKYNREGGQVWIRAMERDGWVVVEVEDTGYGIREAEIPFIFEQFYRSKAGEIRRQQGTGLGLSISYSIVEKLGGRIVVASQVGKGTTFTICLPVNQSA